MTNFLKQVPNLLNKKNKTSENIVNDAWQNNPRSKPSNAKNIYRHHTTKMTNLPWIIKDGLVPWMTGKGYSDVLRGSGIDLNDLAGVYTTSREPFPKNIISFKNPNDFNSFKETTYTPTTDEVTLNLEIPKDDYKKMERLDTNPEEYVSDAGFDHGDLLQTVQNGGRTDIFKYAVSPKYIKNGTKSDRTTADIEDIIKNYKCKYDCDKWNTSLRNTGFMLPNGEWNDLVFDMVFRGKKP